MGGGGQRGSHYCAQPRCRRESHWCAKRDLAGKLVLKVPFGLHCRGRGQRLPPSDLHHPRITPGPRASVEEWSQPSFPSRRLFEKGSARCATRAVPKSAARENRNPASSLSEFRRRLCRRSEDPGHWQDDPPLPRAQNKSGKDAGSPTRSGRRSSRGSESRVTPVGGAFPCATESFPAPHPRGRTPASLKSSWHRGARAGNQDLFNVAARGAGRDSVFS